MTRMNEERDSILRIRAQVDNFDEKEELRSQISQVSTPPVNYTDTRIILCSPQKATKVFYISVAQARHEFNLDNFSSRLARFFRLYSNVETTRQRLENCPVRLNAYLFAFLD
jgi:hypothetical protein